ncbi:vWA domain-containing protein [Nocardioides litoris]|uniref:vWA domain-containing protein n=1 Tax=Nocardioides litoris TaxID=1926648 RepID=UPI00111CCC7E|nr:vWA domain-containing protein [Nocardioides litoris]
MTDQTLTHLYFLLDRSGSMQTIKSDIEGGFAAFLAEQREAPGRCVVTLAQFDDRYDVVHAGLDVADVPPLVLAPRGSTALHDAMGRLVTDAGAELAALPEAERPGTVIVAVMTDGLENASREWHAQAVKALVEQQSATYGWQFLYMGADQDAVEVGTSLGVPAEQSMTYARGKGRQAMGAKSEKIRSMRAARMTDAAAPMPAYTAAERRDLADPS